MSNISIDAPIKTQHGLFLRRFLQMLQMMMAELEWELQSETLSDARKKKLKRYKENFIGWVLRDILTSTQNTESYNIIFDELNSERAKDLSLWLEMGLNCKNLPEIMEVLNNAQEKAA